MLPPLGSVGMSELGLDSCGGSEADVRVSLLLAGVVSTEVAEVAVVVLVSLEAPDVVVEDDVTELPPVLALLLDAPFVCGVVSVVVSDTPVDVGKGVVVPDPFDALEHEAVDPNRPATRMKFLMVVADFWNAANASICGGRKSCSTRTGGDLLESSAPWSSLHFPQCVIGNGSVWQKPRAPWLDPAAGFFRACAAGTRSTARGESRTEHGP